MSAVGATSVCKTNGNSKPNPEAESLTDSTLDCGPCSTCPPDSSCCCSDHTDAPPVKIDYAALYLKQLADQGIKIKERKPELVELPDDACEEGETSGFKFPSYDAFLKEEEEEQAKEVEEANKENKEAESAEPTSDPSLDSAFDSFLNEIEHLPQTNILTRRIAAKAALEGKSPQELAAAKTAKVVLKSFQSSEQECVRLTAQVFSNPFQVLLLTPEATDEDIRRQYRKLSLLIHPDKCKHEKAQDAFQTVSKAYEQLQQAECRERYKDIIEDAKKKVLKTRIKENKEKRAAHETPLTEDLTQLRGEVFEMCEKMLKEKEQRREYAEATQKANAKYERDKEDKLIEEEKEQCRQRLKFIEKRDERVDSWRQYKTAINNKDVKHSAFTGIRHIREERKEEDIEKKRKKVNGIDNSYKLNWR